MQIYSQNVANDDAENLVTIIKRASAWFGHTVTVLDGEIVKCIGYAHELERLEGLLCALGYFKGMTSGHVTREELGDRVELTIAVGDIAELYT
jgi:hypothetical protein